MVGGDSAGPDLGEVVECGARLARRVSETETFIVIKNETHADRATMRRNIGFRWGTFFRNEKQNMAPRKKRKKKSKGGRKGGEWHYAGHRGM